MKFESHSFAHNTPGMIHTRKSSNRNKSNPFMAEEKHLRDMRTVWWREDAGV
jgi:hypothetical protein